jgi:hypothetical protein
MDCGSFPNRRMCCPAGQRIAGIGFERHAVGAMRFRQRRETHPTPNYPKLGNPNPPTSDSPSTKSGKSNFPA